MPAVPPQGRPAPPVPPRTAPPRPALSRPAPPRPALSRPAPPRPAPSRPAPPRPALSWAVLLCAVLLCGCVSTGPGRDPGPARTVAPAAPAAPSPLPAAGAGTSVERYGVAEGDPGAQPTGRRADEAGGGPATAGDPHGSEAAGRGRGAEARPSHLRRLRPQRRAAGRHGAHGGTHHGRRPGPHTGGRHTGGRGGVCDLGTRFGRWAPGSAAERTCRQVYG